MLINKIQFPVKLQHSNQTAAEDFFESNKL